MLVSLHVSVTVWVGAHMLAYGVPTCAERYEVASAHVYAGTHSGGRNRSWYWWTMLERFNEFQRRCGRQAKSGARSRVAILRHQAAFYSACSTPANDCPMYRNSEKMFKNIALRVGLPLQ